MSVLPFKIVASPLLICAASLVGRRWGQSVAGWLVGLPLTSGPVALFLALDYGSDFAARAAIGSLAGTAVQAGFCFGYIRTARWFGWPVAFAVATIAFALGAVALELVAPSPALTLLLALAALAVALALLPPAKIRIASAPAAPRWDLPARMIVAASLVLGLSAAAPLIGPRLAGLLATFPVFATVLAVFAHHLNGEAAARQVLRGLLIGLYGFAGFFAVLAAALPVVGLAAAFLGATVTALLVQGCTLWLMRLGGAPRRSR
jgi:hypothetical protein